MLVIASIVLMEVMNLRYIDTIISRIRNIF
jgi:hypothetical protein